jgi:peptide chain release factor subunit 1
MPVSSVYLDVDGRRYPRRGDYLVRAEELCHHLRRQAEGMDRERRLSVERDAARAMEFAHALSRGWTRGVALFSSSGAGLWEEVRLPRPVRDRATVDGSPHLVPLEAMAEAYECFCTVLVDREKARLFLSRMGRVQEQSEVLDEVPNRHEQGGWSQARFQRHVDDHVAHHLKHVGEVVFRLFEREGFDHLILAGPDELLPEFERGLHDYLRRRVVSRQTLPVSASADEVLARSLRVEEEIEAAEELAVLERVRAGAASGRGAVNGLGEVLEALNAGRVATLVVPFGLETKGFRCSACGRLAVQGDRCGTCQGDLDAVADVVESAVAAALRGGVGVETLSFTATPADGAHVGALLRY